MSFEFDNSKNKYHLLQSLVQEIKENSRIKYNHKLIDIMLKAYIHSGLIFNFDLDTQLKLTRLYDNIQLYNRAVEHDKLPNSETFDLLQKSFNSLAETLKGIT